jgi:ABC-type glycerol-3-phosphate transport system substrate-binding protein
MRPDRWQCQPWRHTLQGLCSLLALLLVGALLMGCSGEPEEPAVTATQTPTATLDLPAARRSTPVLQPTPTFVAPGQPLTLTLWLAPDMALGDLASGAVIANWSERFAQLYPGSNVQIIPKEAYGAGGLSQALLATQPVVPARLPDIVVVDTVELYQLVDAGLATPLDVLLPPSLWDDLYPFALEAASVDGIRFAAPYRVDIPMMVYNRTMVQTPPRTWDELLANRAEYLFPLTQGDSQRLADMFLIQYLSYGGLLVQGDDRPFLDASVVAQVLRNYRRAADADVLRLAARRLQDLEEGWSLFLSGQAAMCNATALQYLRDRSQLRGAGFAAIPAPLGEATPLASVWGWVIVTPDPTKQEAAARYILGALEADRHVAWLGESHYLPAQPSLLPRVVEDELFRTFLTQQLRRVLVLPRVNHYAQLQDIITRAIEDVLDGVSTPERAGNQVAAEIARLR